MYFLVFRNLLSVLSEVEAEAEQAEPAEPLILAELEETAAFSKLRELEQTVRGAWVEAVRAVGQVSWDLLGLFASLAGGSEYVSSAV